MVINGEYGVVNIINENISFGTKNFRSKNSTLNIDRSIKSLCANVQHIVFNKIINNLTTDGRIKCGIFLDFIMKQKSNGTHRQQLKIKRQNCQMTVAELPENIFEIRKLLSKCSKVLKVLLIYSDSITRKLL